MKPSPEPCVVSRSPATFDCVAGILGSAQRSLPKSRPRLLRWRLSSLFQILHCGGLAAKKPAGPARATRPTPRPARAANGGTANGATSLPRAIGGDSVPASPGRLRQTWRWGQRVAGPREMAPTRRSASISPRARQATAQPIGSETWRAASSPWLYAALFCRVIVGLELEFVTSSFKRTNRKGSREEAVLPPRLCFFGRVSERGRAEGAGERASRVARMSSEAPPLRLYIKRWRGARRRHFALEWSSL